MSRMHQLLAVIIVGGLAVAAGQVATFQTPGAPQAAPAVVDQPAAADEPAPASCDEPTSLEGPDSVPPGCCTRNCTKDSDCRRLCGPEGICMVESPCCIRCVC